MDRREIREWLDQQAEADYQRFSAGLIPGCRTLRGIRLPVLRKKAKEIAAGDWRTFCLEYGLCGAGGRELPAGALPAEPLPCGEADSEEWFEEIQLQGMVIGSIKAEPEEILALARRFVPKIDNWSVNDSFCSGFRLAKRRPETVWNFLSDYKDSKNEYELRMAAVMAMTHFINDEYIDRVLSLLKGLKHEGYYLKMGVAWALSAAYVKYPEKTKELLQQNSLDDFTYHKAIRKMLESYRVSDEDKVMLRGMMRTS